MNNRNKNSLFKIQFKTNIANFFFTKVKILVVVCFLFFLFGIQQYGNFKFAQGTITYRDKQITELNKQIIKLKSELSLTKSNCKC